LTINAVEAHLNF